MGTVTLTRSERFWFKVNKFGKPHSTRGRCWEWAGTIMTVGYGMITIAKVKLTAHRLSWEIHNGPIPAGMMVLHHCDNRKCVRPDHLFLGTHKDNYRDAFSKDRHSRGERHGGAKVTDEIVRQIRRTYRFGSRTHGIKALSERFGINPSAVYKIIKKIHWKHIK